MDEDGGSGALATCLRVMSEVQQQFFALGGWAGVYIGLAWGPGSGGASNGKLCCSTDWLEG